MNMTEKLARALHDSFYTDEDSGAWMSGKCPLDSVTIDGDVDMLKAATAVLTALSEPTEDMIAAALEPTNEGDFWAADIKAIWKAMLAAASKD